MHWECPNEYADPRVWFALLPLKDVTVEDVVGSSVSISKLCPVLYFQKWKVLKAFEGSPKWIKKGEILVKMVQTKAVS